jgi:hypothetical protein
VLPSILVFPHRKNLLDYSTFFTPTTFRAYYTYLLK